MWVLTLFGYVSSRACACIPVNMTPAHTQADSVTSCLFMVVLLISLLLVSILSHLVEMGIATGMIFHPSW
jgi:hypothetical protein